MLRPVDGIQSLSYTAPSAAAPQVGPQDRYEPGSPREGADLREAARLLDSKLRLEKGQRDYLQTAWSAAGDGSVYAGYSESKGTRGYVSSIAADGTVRWELPFDQGSIRQVKALPQGGVAVATARGLTIAGPDGRIQAHQPARGEVADLHVDSAGTCFVLEGTERRLQARSAQGSPLDLPAGLAEAAVASLRPTPEGGVLVRGADKAWKLSPGGQLEAETPMPSWPAQKDTKFEVAESWALPGGDSLLQKRATTTTWPLFRHGMESDPMFGGQVFRQPTITVKQSLVRVSREGQELWEAPGPGEKACAVVLSDGSAFFVDQDQHLVQRVDAQGRILPAFQLPEPVSDMRAAVEDTLLVRHGNTVSRFTVDGQPLQQVVLPQERSRYRLEGEGSPDQVLFTEPEGRIMWSCNVASGSWSRLTDPVGDHSVALTVENLRQESPAAGQVQQEDGWITIGGVRLPKRHS